MQDMTIERSIQLMEHLTNGIGLPEEKEAWQTLKAFVLAQQHTTEQSTQCVYQHMHNEYRSHYNYCPFCGIVVR